MATTAVSTSPDCSVAPPIARLLRDLLAPRPDEACGSTSALACADEAAARPTQAYAVLCGAVPFAGSIGAGVTHDGARALGSRRRDLLGIAAALHALRPGGRAALVVPESMLEGTTRGHGRVRRMLLEENGLQAVIALAAGVARPRTRAAILVFVRGAQTHSIWFDELNSAASIPPLLLRWQERERSQRAPAPAFWLRREQLAAPNYALGIVRCRAAHAAQATPPAPEQILHEIAGLEAEILQGIRDLVGMLK